MRSNLGLPFDYLGEHEVKNISNPVRVYRVLDESRPPDKDKATGTVAIGLPDKPSIAVLPLDDLGGDSDQEYFADGITEDLITALSRIRCCCSSSCP